MVPNKVKISGSSNILTITLILKEIYNRIKEINLIRIIKLYCVRISLLLKIVNMEILVILLMVNKISIEM